MLNVWLTDLPQLSSKPLPITLKEIECVINQCRRPIRIPFSQRQKKKGSLTPPPRQISSELGLNSMKQRPNETADR